MAEALLGYIAARDHRLMHRINGWRAPRWLQLWMICATRGGDGWLWYIMAAVVAMFGGPAPWRALGAASLAAGAGIGVFLFLKRATRRRRPYFA